MSSLQKFHRRTQSGGAAPASFTSIGAGSDTAGFWLGGTVSDKLIVAPRSTESGLYKWGTYGTARGTLNTTNGLPNTNTLYAFGQAAHPAAYYCKSLTTGGYNTWYMPASLELQSIISNQYATPFNTANSFSFTMYYQSSTEGPTVGGNNVDHVYTVNAGSGALDYSRGGKNTLNPVRAVRRTTV